MLFYKFKKLPLSWHLIAASFCLAVAAASTAYSLFLSEQKRSGLESELVDVKQRQQRASATALVTALNFTHELPSRRKSDDIVKDIGQFANMTGVQINAIHVRSREATEPEYGSVEFSIALSGDYRATKAWLSELLARYRAMAVSTLNTRQGTQDVSRLESQISLVLYVRD